MKAYVLQSIGDMKLKDVPEPVPRDDEVVIRVRACGICGSDIPRIYRDGAHKMPLIPGHEFAGEVEAVGRGADKKLLHKRVGVFPLIPCGKCTACRKGKYELCRNYSYLGSRRDGGFAEYAAVPEVNLVELPERVSFEMAAMLEPVAVAVHAMRRILPCGKAVREVLQQEKSGRAAWQQEKSGRAAWQQMKSGRAAWQQVEEGRTALRQGKGRVAVYGLGTVGLLLVMLLKEAGILNIFAIGNKDSQKAAVLGMGLSGDCFIDSRKEDVSRQIMERTDGEGADVFFECVGRNETVVRAIDLTAAEGQVCLVGNPFTDIGIPKDVYWKILRNQIMVTGTWNSSFTGSSGDDWHYALGRLADKSITPEKLISHRFSLEGLGEGLQIMRGKTEDYIKIMGIIN